MAKRAHQKPKTIRSRRGSASPVSPPPLRQEPELSNYELIERRSRELEEERAKGGHGASQPPDAATPLLFQNGGAPAAERNESNREEPGPRAPSRRRSHS